MRRTVGVDMLTFGAPESRRKKDILKTIYERLLVDGTRTGETARSRMVGFENNVDCRKKKRLGM